MSSAWLKSIRRGCDAITDIPGHTLDDTVTIIKGGDSGFPSIDDAIKGLDFVKKGDELTVGNARWRDVEPLLRKGSIDEAFNLMGVSHTISSADQANFKKALTSTSPDVKIDELNDKTTVAKKYHSDLDVTNGKTGAELEAKLSTASKEKTKTMYQKLKAKAGPIAIGAGLFTTLVFGIDMWADLNDAIESRNGCFIVETNSGSTSCKVASHTCGFGTEGNPPCDTTQMTGVEYNIRLMCLDLLAGDAAGLTDLNATALNPKLDATNIEEVLTVEANIAILLTFYDTYYVVRPPSIDACTLAGLSDDCVACDTTAPTNSVFFINTIEMEGNTSVRCIKDSTLLDTLVDVSTEMGVELFDAVGDSISGSFSGNFFLTIFIILFTIMIIMIVLKAKGKKTTDTSPAAQPPPAASASQPPPAATATPPRQARVFE